MRDRRHDPLPAPWLPDPSGPSDDDAAAWDRRVRSIMAEAAPRLEELRADAGGRGAWTRELGRRWRSAAALAAAASAALVLLPGAEAGGPPPASRALAAAAADGQPAALWRAGGQPADPVLALVALESGSAGGRATGADQGRRP